MAGKRTILRNDQVRRFVNTTAYWEAHPSIVPERGDVYIYTDGSSITEDGVTTAVPKVKVGDGETVLSELPFIDDYVSYLIAQLNDSIAALATVATSGSYNDLDDKPTNVSFGQAAVQAAINNTSANINVTLSNYKLVGNGVVSIMFKNNVPANAKLNINSQGSRVIWYRGAPIAAGVIKAGDRCLFMYNSSGSCYHLLAIDRWGVDIAALTT